MCCKRAVILLSAVFVVLASCNPTQIPLVTGNRTEPPDTFDGSQPATSEPLPTNPPPTDTHPPPPPTETPRPTDTPPPPTPEPTEIPFRLVHESPASLEVINGPSFDRPCCLSQEYGYAVIEVDSEGKSWIAYHTNGNTPEGEQTRVHTSFVDTPINAPFIVEMPFKANSTILNGKEGNILLLSLKNHTPHFNADNIGMKNFSQSISVDVDYNNHLAFGFARPNEDGTGTIFGSTEGIDWFTTDQEIKPDTEYVLRVRQDADRWVTVSVNSKVLKKAKFYEIDSSMIPNITTKDHITTKDRG